MKLPKGWFKEPKRHSKASKEGWRRRKLGLPPLSYEELMSAHKQRRLQAQLRDERFRAKHTIDKQDVYEGEDSYMVHSWVDQPGRKDVEGIDTPPTKVEMKVAEERVKTRREEIDDLALRMNYWKGMSEDQLETRLQYEQRNILTLIRGGLPKEERLKQEEQLIKVNVALRKLESIKEKQLKLPKEKQVETKEKAAIAKVVVSDQDFLARTRAIIVSQYGQRERGTDYMEAYLVKQQLKKEFNLTDEEVDKRLYKLYIQRKIDLSPGKTPQGYKPIEAEGHKFAYVGAYASLSQKEEVLTEKKTKAKKHLEEQHKQAFKNRFYDQMNEERRNEKDSLFPMYNALHNLETAKMVNYQGAANSREERLSEIASALHNAEKVGRKADAEKLLNEYNHYSNENITLDFLEYERTRMPITTMKVIQERKDKEKSLDLAKKHLAKEKKRLQSKELDYKECETTEKMIDTLEYNINVLEKDLGIKKKEKEKSPPQVIHAPRGKIMEVERETDKAKLVKVGLGFGKTAGYSRWIPKSVIEKKNGDEYAPEWWMKQHW